ncbi:MAG TPA: type II toxin-antitoxin system prevent-host-death family antitoxin [Terriglobia bacterium]|nr:type II toxin-antitoxin system prevent-host-death family antitoxin [Terriglobia bacterium]
MDTVGLFDAKTHLSALLERVDRGEEITITKHGTPVALMVPAGNRRKRDPRKVAERIRALRKGAKLKGLSVRQLIEEGRRF